MFSSITLCLHIFIITITDYTHIAHIDTLVHKLKEENTFLQKMS